MIDPPPQIGRRSLLLGSSALVATSTAGCELLAPHTQASYGPCHYGQETLIGGDQKNCLPRSDGTNDLAWHLRKMSVPNAWAYSKSKDRPAQGEGILIGHIDTGVAAHNEFDAGGIRWDLGYDFIDGERGGYDPLVNHLQYIEQIGHGTGTASVIVSRGDVTASWALRDSCGGTTGTTGITSKADKGRITGVAPAAQLVPVRAFRLAATRNLDLVARGIRYLIQAKVDVITMALGWPFSSQELRSAIREAIDANILVLAAAGNFVSMVTFPANDGDVIAVAGLGPDDQPWCGSSRGPTVTVSAYGDRIWRAYRDEKSNRLDLVGPRFGTSYAVSLTAGVAALWVAHCGRRPLINRLTGQQRLQDLFREALVKTACRPTSWDQLGGQFGAGIVNAEALLQHGDSMTT